MRRLAVFALVLASTVGGLSARTPDPQRWRDEYIADPARKAMIERYVTPMDKEIYTALRTLTLAKIVTKHCDGSAFDPDIVRNYVEESGLARQSRDGIELATNVVNAEFSYFDMTRLRVVCAGAAHLFGDKGVLVPELVSPGLGLPAWSEPRGDHWITVEPFLVNVDGVTRSLGKGSAPARPPRRSPGVGRRTADQRTGRAQASAL